MDPSARTLDQDGQHPQEDQATKMKLKRLESFALARKDLPTPVNAVRTAVAATASLLIARLFGLQADYWAAITCIIVTQSTLGAALPVSVQRLAGAAIGATAGALAVTLIGSGFLAFGFCVFAVGILCWILRIDRGAYRYAGITVAVVMLINRNVGIWTFAFHRFAEVSIGIAVALTLTSVWPERPSAGVQK